MTAPMPETMSPREAEDLLFYKLKDLILEQSEGEWDDATIVRDAHHFANHLRPLMSPALASSGDHSGDATNMIPGDHAELARLAEETEGPFTSETSGGALWTSSSAPARPPPS